MTRVETHFLGQRQDSAQDARPAAVPLRVLKRDGAPLAISLILHIVVLVLLAPWLVMRTIPSPQVEVEVMIETDASEPPRSRPAKAMHARAQAKPQPRIVKPQQRPVPAPPVRTEPPKMPPLASKTPAAQPGQSGRGANRATRVEEPGGAGAARAPAPREAAGLTAPRNLDVRRAAAPLNTGVTAMQRGSEQPSPVTPRAPSLGSTPQPSARAAATPSRPGEDRQDGPATLAGPVAQAQSAQPEFRQAARQGGQVSMRGGSQAPDDGLARQPGQQNQTALFAARDVPQSQPGSGASRGGSSPALAAPVSRSSGQGSVVVAERAAPTLAQAALPGAGVGAAAIASKSPSPGGGQGSAGAGSGSSRAAVPGERGSGLLAAAAPGSTGPGTASSGAGPGASVAGEGRAQLQAGSGSAVSEPAAPLLAAASSAVAARAGGDSSAAQLSGRSEAPAQPQALREARVAPLQTQQPTGQARVIEERFTATALKVDSPRSICSLPLMFAGFDRKPIPEGLDSINATAARLQDETPPRHHPANQAPRYPIQALGLRAEGRVIVRAEIRPDGTIGKRWIKQSSGMQVLDLAALETVQGWRFHPAERHGMAVAVWLDVPIEYKLP